MEMRVQALHSGVVAMRWGFPWCRGGSTKCGSNEVWLEKVVAEQVRPYQKDFGSLHPLLRRKICDWGGVFTTYGYLIFHLVFKVWLGKS